MPLVKINDLNGPKEEVEDFVDRATMISQQYDDFLEMDEGDGHLRAPGIHASEISDCERRMVYNVLGTTHKSKIRKTWRQRFEVGKALHAMLQRDFLRMAMNSRGLITFDYEVPIGPQYQKIAKELNIHSSCDGVFTFRDDPFGPAVLRVGLEIKTESPDGYDKLNSPRAKHIEQAHVYMKALDLPLLWFLYFNKGNQNNTSSMAPFLIRFNPELWAVLETRCRRVLSAVQRNELPERQEGLHCEFCPFSHVCQPAYLNKKMGGAARWKQPRSL